MQAAELLEHLAAEYPALGAPLELTPMSFDFKVSNHLFTYVTATGRHLLKAIAHAEALYGQQHVAERLEVVARAISELAAGGLPVERIIAARNGRFVQPYRGALLRLYAFDPGRAFQDSAQDLAAAAGSLRRLHGEGLAALSAETRDAMTRFEPAYPLTRTAPELPALRAFVEGGRSDPAWLEILERWPLIERTVARALERPLPPGDCLVHLDFHPRNALFSDERPEATIIDLDNATIDRRLKCLGFSILRFAFFGKERSRENLARALVLFTDEPVDALVHAMSYLEIEKVLRILQRLRTTGQYGAFVSNITSLHLANVELLESL